MTRALFPRAIIVAAATGWLALMPARVVAEPVDLELVLAIDVSGSIDEEEAILQRQGYIAAIKDERVVGAIKSGYLGRIAVTYIEWAGSHYQKTVADWTVIYDQASAEAFAESLARQPITTELWTSISGAIEYALQRFQDSPHTSKRRVIDISGDGPNNRGGSVIESRERAIRQGITINGLPIINDRPSRWGLRPMPDLDLYYEDCVIGGRGAFLVVAESFGDFARAVRRKLILEIADLYPPPRLAAERPARPLGPARGRPPCDAGERQMMERYWDR